MKYMKKYEIAKQKMKVKINVRQIQYIYIVSI